jgi:beta-galactosidase beta subunit
MEPNQQGQVRLQCREQQNKKKDKHMPYHKTYLDMHVTVSTQITFRRAGSTMASLADVTFTGAQYASRTGMELVAW